MSKMIISENKLQELIQDSIYEVLMENNTDERLGHTLGKWWGGIRNGVKNFKNDFKAGVDYKDYQNSQQDSYSYFGDEADNVRNFANNRSGAVNRGNANQQPNNINQVDSTSDGGLMPHPVLAKLNSTENNDVQNQNNNTESQVNPDNQGNDNAESQVNPDNQGGDNAESQVNPDNNVNGQNNTSTQNSPNTQQSFNRKNQLKRNKNMRTKNGKKFKPRKQLRRVREEKLVLNRLINEVAILEQKIKNINNK